MPLPEAQPDNLEPSEKWEPSVKRQLISDLSLAILLTGACTTSSLQITKELLPYHVMPHLSDVVAVVAEEGVNVGIGISALSLAVLLVTHSRRTTFIDESGEARKGLTIRGSLSGEWDFEKEA